MGYIITWYYNIMQSQYTCGVYNGVKVRMV